MVARMTRETPVRHRKPDGPEPREASLLTRRRFQFAGALLFRAS